jgi:hypothetical protein
MFVGLDMSDYSCQARIYVVQDLRHKLILQSAQEEDGDFADLRKDFFAVPILVT